MIELMFVFNQLQNAKEKIWEKTFFLAVKKIYEKQFINKASIEKDGNQVSVNSAHQSYFFFFLEKFN